MKQLPDKLSELIRVGLADVRKAEQNPVLYDVRMDVWHVTHEGKCLVCMAGAVMAFSLDVPDSKACYPHECGPADNDKLLALDLVRDNCAYSAVRKIHGDGSAVSFSTDTWVPDYQQDREGFHKALEIIAAELEAAGL